MNDQDFNKQKARIKALEAKWVGPLGLRWWKISFEYLRDKDSDDSFTYKPSDAGWGTIMQVRSDYYYKTAHVAVFCPAIENVKDDMLEEYFLHELMHIFLKPMQTKAKAGEEELVATSLASAFKWIEADATRRTRIKMNKQMKEKKHDQK